MSTSFAYTPDYLKRERLERKKEKFQKKLEDVRIALDAYSHQYMESIKKIDEFQMKIPLVTHQPTRETWDKKYEKLIEERDTAFSRSLECKATVDTLIYYIDQLDVEINGLAEDATLSDD